MTEPHANPARSDSPRPEHADPRSADPDGHGREPRRRSVRIAAWAGAGALLALRWPRIGAGALGATALALVGATGVTLALGHVPNPHVPTVELVGLTVFYYALFAGPAALLWTGARRGPA